MSPLSTTVPKGVEWYLYPAHHGGCTGSLDMLGYVEMKLPTSTQGTFSIRSLYDLSHPFMSLGRISTIRLNTGWTTSIWQGGVVLVVHRDRLKDWFRARSLATKVQLLSFNKTQSRVITGLLTGNNTLKRYLYVMGLSSNPTCRKCGTEEETSVHVLCECQALASLWHAHLGSFFLDPEDVTNLSMGAIWNFGRGTRFL